MYINNFVVNMVSKASQPSRFSEPTKTNLRITKVAEQLMPLFRQLKNLLKNLFKTDLVENPHLAEERAVEVAEVILEHISEVHSIFFSVERLA